jgi:hypothetical protein
LNEEIVVVVDAAVIGRGALELPPHQEVCQIIIHSMNSSLHEQSQRIHSTNKEDDQDIALKDHRAGCKQAHIWQITVAGTQPAFMILVIAAKGSREGTKDSNQVQPIQDKHHDPRSDTKLDDIQRVSFEALPKIRSKVEIAWNSKGVPEENMNHFELQFGEATQKGNNLIHIWIDRKSFVLRSRSPDWHQQ